jgi:hypothetical protein
MDARLSATGKHINKLGTLYFCESACQRDLSLTRPRFCSRTAPTADVKNRLPVRPYVVNPDPPHFGGTESESIQEAQNDTLDHIQLPSGTLIFSLG